MSVDDDWFPDVFPESRTTTGGNEQPFRKPTVTVRPPHKVVLRKFPGPAGILMPNNGGSSINLNSSSTEIPCTQRSLSLFEDGPWEKMVQDFESNQLLVQYNIKWIKTKASHNQLTNWKAPFLAAMVQAIECSESINVILKDITGEIQAAVIQNLYEEHSDNFKVGSVLILKHFGVLTTGQNSSNHYLTITSKNLVCIYAKQESDDDNEECSVRKIEVQNFDSRSFTPTTTSPNVSDDFEDDFQIPDGFEESAFRNFELSESQRSSNPRMSQETSNVPEVCGGGDDGRRLSGENGNWKENSRPNSDSLHNIANDNRDSKEDNLKRRNVLNAFEDGDELAFTDLDRGGSSPKKFKFRPRKKDKPRDDVIVTCSQVTVKTSAEHSTIWQSVLEDVDEDALFGDF